MGKDLDADELAVVAVAVRELPGSFKEKAPVVLIAQTERLEVTDFHLLSYAVRSGIPPKRGVDVGRAELPPACLNAGPWRTCVDFGADAGDSGACPGCIRGEAARAVADAVEDWGTKGRQGHCLRRSLNVPFPTIVMSEADELALFSGGAEQGWQAFYARYPTALGVVSFSRVGFDAAKTHAVLSIGRQGGPTAGQGLWVVLERRSGAWFVLRSEIVWES
jgi:hypothetical protein